jgi:hypothetical protein
MDGDKTPSKVSISEYRSGHKVKSAKGVVEIECAALE